MSQENVDVVRGHYEALNNWLESYWADPGQPLGETPRLDEVFDRMDPEVEWDWALSSETFRGRDQLLEAAADWIDTVGEWRVEVDEVIDGSGDRVLAVLRVLARGKGSGAPVDQRIFTAITVRNGKVARMEDYTERAEALEAAGLSE
jgi:ketosteroid isomerase-like protein